MGKRITCIKGLFYGLLIMVLVTGCKKNDEFIQYHKFKSNIWNRFDKIKFDIPVLNTENRYDVIFFADLQKEYEFDNLEFNMIMTTPSGEERINEFRFLIKDKTGGFTGIHQGDSIISSIPLKKGLRIEKKGMLRIEIETLVPRMQITSLLGVGIRLIPSSQ